MNFFLSVVASFLFSASLLVVGVVNPIHSLLALRSVTFLGSVLLFSLSLEYYALLFLIVYVGAIVVLFLFVVIRLEIKRVNTVTSFEQLFSLRGIIIAFVLFEVLYRANADFLTTASLLSDETGLINLREMNLFTDYSALIQRTDQLRGVGSLLFTEYKLTLLIVGVLLFLARVGAIVLSLDVGSNFSIKTQDPNNQTLRNPALAAQGFRYLKKV